MPFIFPEGVAGLFRLTVVYGISGTAHPFHSVHYYQAVSGAGAAVDLADAFTDPYGDVFCPIVSELVAGYGVIVTNLGSPTDFYTEASTRDGEVTGELLAPWDCWVFREATGNRLANYGYKRIGYLTENVVESGGAAIAAIADELAAYASFLSQTLVGGVANYVPSLTSEANESHDDDLVLPFIGSVYQKHGHAVARKSY